MENEKKKEKEHGKGRKSNRKITIQGTKEKDTEKEK